MENQYICMHQIAFVKLFTSFENQASKKALYQSHTDKLK